MSKKTPCSDFGKKGCRHQNQTTVGSNQYQSMVSCKDCPQRLMILSWKAEQLLANKASGNIRATLTFDSEQLGNSSGAQTPPMGTSAAGAANRPSEQVDPEEFEVIHLPTEDASTQTDAVVILAPAKLDALMQMLEEARQGQFSPANP